MTEVDDLSLTDILAEYEEVQSLENNHNPTNDNYYYNLIENNYDYYFLRRQEVIEKLASEAIKIIGPACDRIISSELAKFIPNKLPSNLFKVHTMKLIAKVERYNAIQEAMRKFNLFELDRDAKTDIYNITSHQMYLQMSYYLDYIIYKYNTLLELKEMGVITNINFNIHE